MKRVSVERANERINMNLNQFLIFLGVIIFIPIYIKVLRNYKPK